MISKISELFPLLQPEELIYQRTDKAAAAELQDRSHDTHKFTWNLSLGV